jgi:MFS family permease
MFKRLSNSWELVKASAGVLRADKELLIFPVISAIGSLIVLATFAIPMFLAGLFEAMFADEFGPAKIAGYAVAFLFYLCQYFVIIFANSALVGAAMIRLKGGDPTVSDGFRIAFDHIGAIFGYALLSATVGLILRWLSEQKLIGQIAASLFGLAWNLATFLVIPVLVVEGIGPVEAVKRSGRMLKETWGEQIAGNFSIGFVFGILTVLIAILAIPLIIFTYQLTNTVVIPGILVALLVLVVVLINLISSALTGIYTAAVYRYDTDGESGQFFQKDLVANAFRPK